jgi:hypothetical protein
MGEELLIENRRTNGQTKLMLAFLDVANATKKTAIELRFVTEQ